MLNANRQARRSRDDDDDDEDEDSPRKKESGGGGGKIAVILLIIGGVAVCCLCMPIGIGVALMFPAITKVQESAARTQSINNLKNVGLSFHGFHDMNKRLPFNGSDLPPPNQPGAKYNSAAIAGNPMSGSWAFQILPFIDQEHLYRNPDRTSGIKPYMCPGRNRPMVDANGGAWTDYFYNNYLNDANRAGTTNNPDMKRTLVGITDGSSNTVLVGHGNIAVNQYKATSAVHGSTNIYLGGNFGTMRAGNNGVSNPTGVNLRKDSEERPQIGSWGGPFSSGALMSMGDATVRTFPYTTVNLGAFLTPTGGEAVMLPDT